ncbi:UDP-N-acetylglucosamine 4,6-dehydratase family protein [Paenibacillus phoenicis]|uniref:UDP-N-acetylglucosamine 4,6-dehydratase family protein n=1 Tax=Paenibacillus phoenicis TaxID=554117 RepID=A0ABU5PN36_9BACL|nr:MULTISPECIES: UDP-N-acetylglucosamine 4,6-dehydratase family protein [Paenibacillus]EES72683.1 putative UDP-glucose 4-epimerase [Paenibacillus sp. oral taxon 786 str. D14]MEA3571353.1 UDP-N-acetylglucosamine 4,6-dehydratase family protein [Paenibacillus phoenicis]
MNKMYEGKKILITGGTGTIGSHLTRRLLEEKPAVIRIFSRDEYKQFEMGQELQEYAGQLRFLIGDVRDQQRLSRAMEGIDYVFHCAAMKHVPACEYNPFEAVQTNVIGTQNVIQAALDNKVKKVLFTSTDKAISPTNAYGATKLTAERLISAAEYHKGAKSTVFSSVRFGNVMGSRGSVIPLFKKQILEQRKITLTDPDMLRYMMTPSQAIELILEANSLAKGGEVFVLKMPIIKLGDLADVVVDIATQNFNLTEQVKVEIVGARDGEKMVEELMTKEEMEVSIESEKMYIIPGHHSRFHNKDKEKSTHLIFPDQGQCISKDLIKAWLIQEALI